MVDKIGEDWIVGDTKTRKIKLAGNSSESSRKMMQIAADAANRQEELKHGRD